MIKAETNTVLINSYICLGQPGGGGTVVSILPALSEEPMCVCKDLVHYEELMYIRNIPNNFTTYS